MSNSALVWFLNTSCGAIKILLFAAFPKSSDVFFAINVGKIFLSNKYGEACGAFAVC